MPLVTTEYLDELMVNAAVGHSTVAVDGPWYHAKMILFTNNNEITKTTALTDLTQPAYSGYAAQQVAWSAAKRDSQGNISSDTGLVLWQMSNATTPTGVWGYAYTDTGGTNLLGGELFGAQVNLTDALSVLGIVGELNLNNPQAGYSTVVT